MQDTGGITGYHEIRKVQFGNLQSLQPRHPCDLSPGLNTILFSNLRLAGLPFLLRHVQTHYDNNMYETDVTKTAAVATPTDILRKETHSREADSSLAD